ncbi:MAG: protein-L-isoaspartate(D-aspartate) O-methyltransferase [Anaerolineae bacterium]|nr:protein-L-isoaspartate(D-aspartate) O-methyltransferase [Anaerolineae bacterium]
MFLFWRFAFVSVLMAMLCTCAAPPVSTPTVTAVPTSTPSVPDAFTAQRQAMVAMQIRARDVRDPDVLRAMETVPRHEFVPKELLAQAYNDHPLPIGYGQTISQPYIVAVMTELAQVKRGDRVLEIGTGSGYQAAILAVLTDEVYSVEIIPALAESAAERLKRLGYTSVRVKNADGYNGWEEYAPYDAIVVTCAPDHIPPPLIAQLKDGGRMVIPVGPVGGFQTLRRVIKRGDQVLSENVMGVLFVPLVRGK